MKTIQELTKEFLKGIQPPSLDGTNREKLAIIRKFTATVCELSNALWNYVTEFQRIHVPNESTVITDIWKEEKLLAGRWKFQSNCSGFTLIAETPHDELLAVWGCSQYHQHLDINQSVSLSYDDGELELSFSTYRDGKDFLAHNWGIEVAFDDLDKEIKNSEENVIALKALKEQLNGE